MGGRRNGGFCEADFAICFVCNADFAILRFCCQALFAGFGQFKAFALELKFFLSELVQLLPLAASQVVLMEGAHVGEGTLQCALRLGVIAIEFVEPVHILVVPIGDLGFGGVVVELILAVGALDTRHMPLRGGGVFDERRLLCGDGFVVTEVFVEHFHERGGVVAGNEKLLGGGAVLEAIETSVRRGGVCWSWR